MTDRKRTIIFINLMITCIASSMLATALNTALPNMIDEFSISVSTGQWITSAYSLAMGIMMPLTAFLITRFPTRKLYLSAIVYFLLGLILCSIAPNFSVLMCGRILQACGNGILTSMAQVITLTIYPSEKRGTAMGWYGLSVGAAPVIAPTLGGIIVDAFSWRMIFYITIVIIIVSLIYALIVFEDVLNTSKKSFDTISFMFSALAFGGVTLGIGNIGSFSFLSVQVLPLLAVGIVAGIVFSLRQFKLEEPFLDIRILSNKNYTLSVIGSMLLYLVMMGGSIIMPLYVQTIMKYGAAVAGLTMLPGSLIMAIISPFAGKIYDKLGMKVLFVTGTIFMFVSTIAMVFITRDTSIWFASALFAVRSVAIGCLMMPLVTWGTSYIDRSRTAHATALLTSLRTISGAIGQAVFVGIMTSVAAASAASYGENAMMHGLNISFLSMSVGALALVIIAVFFVKKEKK